MEEQVGLAAVSLLLEKLLELRENVYREGIELFESWKPRIKNPDFLNSAMDLAFYLALRRRDIRDLQKELMPWGLSSLGRLESRTLDYLDAVIATLCKIAGVQNNPIKHPSYQSFMMGREQLERNTRRVFGNRPENRYSRIMVTLSSEAAEDYRLIYELISHGMNVARINCAHDHPVTWDKMIKKIRKAEQELQRDCKILMDVAGPKVRIERLSTSLMEPSVRAGDAFFLTGNQLLQHDQGMKIIISCSIPEIISSLQIGDPVLVDDGKIEGEVESITNDGVIVQVKKVKIPKGVKIKAEKGLNFPQSNVKIDILTEKDKQDLDFICQHADMIGCSFIRDAEDIMLYQEEIRNRVGEERAREITLVAKLETVQGFRNLSEIIVTAAGQNPFSVMIARGDLAVEVGYLRLAEIQQEILWICEAGHIPVIWATQVLDNMQKTGIPTRAEITDASESARAECVMLNKGKFILESIDILDSILEKMQEHQYKKTSKLRALGVAEVK